MYSLQNVIKSNIITITKHVKCNRDVIILNNILL